MSRAPSLWRSRDFMMLWTGQSVSRLGSQVSLIAIPFAAVVVLHAGAFQAGLLGAAEYAPFLLIGLPAGAIVDRLRRRRVLIVADIGRCLSLGSIPVVDALGHLTLLQLYVASLVTGVLTVFFDVAYQSYLPALVAPTQLVDGNAKLEVSSSSAQLAGPSVGGVLIAALGAPVAIAADALSYVWSVGCILLIRGREAAPEVSTATGSALRRLRVEIAEGLRYVGGHELIRPIAGCTATANLFGNMGVVLLVLFAVRELGMSATALGLALSIGGAGYLGGALVSRRVSQWLGLGRTVLISSALFPIGLLLIAAAPRSLGVLFVGLGGFVEGGSAVIYNVSQVSLRQAITPTRLLGRLNATMRFIVWGTIPIGSLIGGVLGGVIGLRATFVVAGLGGGLSAIWIALSPVPQVQSIDSAIATSVTLAAR